MQRRLILALACPAIAASPVTAHAQEELNGRAPFPAIFHGAWAPTLADCGGNGLDVIVITARLFRAYESRTVLMESGRVIRRTAPGGRPALAMNARVASSSEGQESSGRLRLIRVGDTLYTSNPAVVAEGDQYDYPNIRCPVNPPWLMTGSH